MLHFMCVFVKEEGWIEVSEKFEVNTYRLPEKTKITTKI